MHVASMGRWSRRLGWVFGVFCAVGAAHAQTAPASPAYPRPMTAEEAKDFAHILGMIKPERPYVLNMADPQQLRFAQNALAQAGRTAATAPETYATLQATARRALAAAAKAGPQALAAQPLLAKSAGAPQDLATISNFGDDGKNVYTATG